MAEVDPPEKGQESKWKRFEKLVYEIQKDFAGTSGTVKHNDSITGIDSKVERQIDISIRQQIGQYSILVVIDCKDYNEPIDVKGVEEFAGLVKDVRANKGALICSNGFTPAAINVAKNHGIDTYRLVDTEAVDWKTYVTVPILLVRTYIAKFSFTFSGTGRILIPYAAEDLANLELFDDDGGSLGTPAMIMKAQWNQGLIPHEPGYLVGGIGKGVNVEFRGVKSKLDVEANVIVKRDFFLGPMRIHTKAFHDAQNNTLITKEIRTGFIDPDAVERGQVPGWKKIDAADNLSVRPFIRMKYSEGYDETGKEKVTETQVTEL